MKIEYLRHEYTWSDRCISGNKLGWGITASSVPNAKEQLRELEKLAQAAVIDETGLETVEELVYSPFCGFVKMSSVPCESGEDRRKNKRVRLYQPKVSENNPAVYLMPGDVWDVGGESGFLPTLFQEEPQIDTREILRELQIYDRLPELFRAVFWCFSGKVDGVNIVAANWKEEEFAANARRFMYVVHMLLPKSLRTRAGYVSFTREALPSVPFYFSKKPLGSRIFSLTEPDGMDDLGEMETYLYQGLANAYRQKSATYRTFMEQAETYAREARDSANLVRKLTWIFYETATPSEKDKLAFATICAQLPELLYWASKEAALDLAAQTALRRIHERTLTRDEQRLYAQALLDGFTARTRTQILQELDWMLTALYPADREQFARLLGEIREQNREVYTELLCGFYGENAKLGTAYGEEIFAENAADMESLAGYVAQLSESATPPDFKDHILRKGITFLNADIFAKESYRLFDEIAGNLNRKEQWVRILEDFVRQLEDHVSELDKRQLDAACYVESLLAGYRPNLWLVLAEEWKRREHKQYTLGEPTDTEAEGRMKKKPRRELIKRKKEEVAVTAAPEEGENVREKASEEAPGAAESFIGTLSFLLLGFPQGFLTGCIIYLSHYSLMIGHWKITLGMGGMWVLLMLNYSCLLVAEKNKRQLWKVIGLCLVEGWIIEIAAWFFTSQKVRLYYFIVLGLLTVLVQLLNVFRLRKKHKTREEQS